MYEGIHLVQVRTTSGDQTFTSPVNSWARSNWGKLFCPECHRVLQGIFPDPVDVHIEFMPEILWYDVVFEACVGVIHEDLFRALHVQSEPFACGRCFDRAGHVIPHLKTMYRMDRFVERGGSGDTDYWRCLSCGLVLGRSGDPYIMRKDIPDGHIFQDTDCCLYLSEERARSLDWKAFRYLKPWMIPIRDEPLADDPLPDVERMATELLSVFDGAKAVHQAILEEVRTRGVAHGAHTLDMSLRGVRLTVKGYTRRDGHFIISKIIPRDNYGAADLSRSHGRSQSKVRHRETPRTIPPSSTRAYPQTPSAISTRATYEFRHLVRLVPRDREDYVVPLGRWAALKHLRNVFCLGCHRIRRDSQSQPIDAHIWDMPDRCSYGSLWRAWLGVIHDSLRHALAPHLEGFRIARCFDRHEKRMPEYHSVYGPECIALRGGANTKYSKCGCCGSVLTNADTYILREEIPPRAVFQDDLCSLYVSADVARRMQWDDYPDLKPVAVPVYDEPLPDDPLPGFLRVTTELTAVFDGDWRTAYQAILEEARLSKVGDGMHSLSLKLRGVHFNVDGRMNDSKFAISAIYGK